MKTPTLENERVKLTLLDLNNYKNLLEVAAQKNLVQYSPTKIDTPKDLKAYTASAIDGYYHKNKIPFIVYDKSTNQYAGNTHYMNIDWRNKVLDIGSTWIGKQFHGTGLNTNMKYLMLYNAFETMGFEKVAFRIDERNIASRKAVEKLGAKLEGILRKNVYLKDGFKRNTCCYGILLQEWPAIKTKLENIISK